MKIIIKNEKGKKETSKIIAFFGGVICVAAIVFSFYMIYITKNIDPLAEIVIGIFGVVGVIFGFYFNKAKLENKIKLMKENKVELTEETFKGEE